MQTDPGVPSGHDLFGGFRSDHACVLAQVNELERQMLAGAGLPDEALLREAVALLVDQFATHMTAEESILYPAIQAAFPAGCSTLESLRADHVELRLMLQSVLQWLEAPASADRGEQLSVVLRDFVDLLRLHIHREESAVFDVALRVLSNTEAECLARQISTLVLRQPPGCTEPGPLKGTQS